MADDETWIELTTFSRGSEADVAISLLQSEAIPAIKRRNDGAGVFGAWFEGPIGGSVTVLVPEESEEVARELLNLESGSQ
jgi:hypothetical protein